MSFHAFAMLVAPAEKSAGRPEHIPDTTRDLLSFPITCSVGCV